LILAITATLLDFMCRIIPHFFPPWKLSKNGGISFHGMDNNVLDKEEGCYDNTEAAFSDDEEEVSNKGKKREFRFHPIREAVGRTC
ncbi:hypothetical protein KUCAC02_036118, partial [Chaenocephalus aceratus]